MNASSSNRNNVVIGVLLAVALLSCAAWAAPGSAQTGDAPLSTHTRYDAAQADKAKKEYFNEEDLKVEQVPGKWILVSSTDLKQSQYYSTPVVLTGIKTVYGRGKYLGRVKMVEAKIENRGQQPTQEIQFRWSIVLHEEPDNVLLEGLMPPAQLRIEPFSGPQIVDIPPIYFNKLVKPLLKDGEIGGTLRSIVGIQEVRYADGTVWQRTPQVALRKASFTSPAFSLRAQRFRPAPFLDLALWRGPTPRPAVHAPCQQQPRSFASAALFIPLQGYDPPCRESRGCGCDFVNNKNICISLPAPLVTWRAVTQRGTVTVGRERWCAPPAPTTTATGVPLRGVVARTVMMATTPYALGSGNSVVMAKITTVTARRIARMRHARTTVPTTTGTCTAQSRATVTRIIFG